MTFAESKTSQAVAELVTSPAQPIVDLLDLELAYVGGGIGDTVL